MVKEESLYKVTYKEMTHGVTKFGLEITVYGEDLDIIQDRFEETIVEMDVSQNRIFKIWQIERK